MSVNVRRMTESDLDTVYEIETRSHITPWKKNILNDCLLVGYDCWVLECRQQDSSTLVGFLIARCSESKCHILNLCIDKSQQLQGYGRTLLTSYLAFVSHYSQIHTILLEVRKSNSAALHLYNALGFEHTETKKDYYVDVNGSEDAVVLEKKMSCG